MLIPIEVTSQDLKAQPIGDRAAVFSVDLGVFHLVEGIGPVDVQSLGVAELPFSNPEKADGLCRRRVIKGERHDDKRRSAGILGIAAEFHVLGMNRQHTGLAEMIRGRCVEVLPRELGEFLLELFTVFVGSG